MAHQISVWSSWHKAADEITKVQVQTTRVFVATTSAVFNTSTSMLSSFGPAEESKIAVAKTQLFQALDRATLVKRADAEMGRLGLKGRAGTIRTPPELLEDADQAFKARGGPATILIPLRESIDGALAALLKRRALQEPASNPEEKVKSIGRQCGREGLPEAHFPDLGASARRIADELSRAKQQNLSREKISDLFYQGITFLTALLESLDEAKLK